MPLGYKWVGHWMEAPDHPKFVSKSCANVCVSINFKIYNDLSFFLTQLISRTKINIFKLASYFTKVFHWLVIVIVVLYPQLIMVDSPGKFRIQQCNLGGIHPQPRKIPVFVSFLCYVVNTCGTIWKNYYLVFLGP